MRDGNSAEGKLVTLELAAARGVGATGAAEAFGAEIASRSELAVTPTWLSSRSR